MKRSGSVSLAAGFVLLSAVACSGTNSSADLPSLGGTDTESADASPSTTEGAVIDFERSMLLLNQCLEEQGIVLDPGGSGAHWIAAELSGEVADGPIRSVHAELVDMAYAECSDEFDGVEQFMEPLEPGDPRLLAQQEAVGACMDQFGFEIERTPTGFNAHPPSEPGTELYEEWESALLDCERVVP